MRILSAEFVKSAANVGGLPDTGVAEIAFAGKSNVGKSSLINAICNHKSLAVTGKTPGRTRLLNFFKIRIADGEEKFERHFVDLPGYGFAKVGRGEQKKWKESIEAYLTQRQELVALMLLIDSRRGIQDEDRILLSSDLEIAVVPVLTKADKLSKNELANVKRSTAKELGLEAGDIFCTALIGKNKTSLDELKLTICNLLA